MIGLQWGAPVPLWQPGLLGLWWIKIQHQRRLLSSPDVQSVLQWRRQNLLSSLHAKGRAHDKVTAKCKERQKRKFDALMERVNAETRHRRWDERWVVNLSSRPLSTAKKDVLARGLNFAPAPKRVPVAEIVATVEDGLRRSSFPQAQLARTRMVGCLTRARPPPTNLCPAEHKAIQNLKREESIVIAPADKGNATVLMNRKNYDRKIRTLLADKETYKSLPKDPTPAQERKMNGILLPLMSSRAGSIPERLYYHLRSSAGKVPLLYGLPKIHKPEVPLRPIVSFVNLPTYTLSKHLVSILSPLVGKSPSHVRNSADFASFIAGQTVH